MPIFVEIHPAPGLQLPQSFETLAELLGSLPGMFFEMDGSFVWVDHDFEPPCQMDGMAYDRQGKLAYVEIKGACSAGQWTTLCKAICGLPSQPLISPVLLNENESQREFDSIEKILRVHRVLEADWTTARAIASQLPKKDGFFG